jgi:energy-coupling factor transporter ATP-binding protein EcfA2
MIINETTDTPSTLAIKVGKQSIDQPLGCPPPFPDKPSVILVAGAPGSGKTNFTTSIMTGQGNARVFYKRFNKVIYATPQETFDSEINHPFKDHPPERLHFELTTGVIEQVIREALVTKSEGGNTIFICDDFGENLKNKHIEKALKKLLFKHRHYNLQVIITAIALKALPKMLRSLIGVYVVFKPRSLIEVEGFVTEVFSLKPIEATQLFDYVFQYPYDFLFYNQITHQYYRNFNELTITKS